MRKLYLATCLVMAAPAMAQGTSQSNRGWTGEALRYTPSSAAGCNVSVMGAATSLPQIMVTLRNGGSAQLSFTLSGELAGNGHRSIGTATVRLPAGRNVRVALMRVYHGSLGGSVLTLRGAACTAVT